MNSCEQPLIYFDFIVDTGPLGRVIVKPSLSFVHDFADCFSKFCHKCEDNSCSLLGAEVVDVRPHSLIRLCSCSGSSERSASSSLAFCSSNALGQCSLAQNITSRNSNNVLQEESTGLLYFGSHTNLDAIHPELVFSGHSCSCLNTDYWRVVGEVFKGFEIIQQIVSFSFGREKKVNRFYSLRECGMLPCGAEFGFKQKDAVIDPWPDSPKDASAVDFSDLERVLKIAYGIKISGSVLFRQELYQMAMFKFLKAIKYINVSHEGKELSCEQHSRCGLLIIPCILNSAACKLKLKDFDGALEDCNEAMELSPHNAKVFFRRGQAHHGKLNYEQSLYDLYRALKLSPHDKSIKSEIAAVEGELQVYRKDVVKKRKMSSPFP